MIRLAAGFGGTAPGWARFGLLMIDGLCRREEVVVATVDAALGDLPVVGGSAGDGLLFRRTRLATRIYAVGSSEGAAYMSGVDVARAKLAAYTLAGLAAGGAGLVASAQTATGNAAVFKPETQTLHMTRNVKVERAAGTVTGPELVVDLRTNNSVFTGGSGGRVTGVFTP